MKHEFIKYKYFFIFIVFFIKIIYANNSFKIPYGSNFFPLNQYPSYIFEKTSQFVILTPLEKKIIINKKRKYKKSSYTITPHFYLSMFDTESPITSASDIGIHLTRFKYAKIDFKFEKFTSNYLNSEIDYSQFDLIFIYGKKFKEHYNLSLGLRYSIPTLKNAEKIITIISEIKHDFSDLFDYWLETYYSMNPNQSSDIIYISPNIIFNFDKIFTEYDHLYLLGGINYSMILTVEQLKANEQNQYTSFEGTVGYNIDKLKIELLIWIGENIPFFENRGLEIRKTAYTSSGGYGINTNFDFSNRFSLSLKYTIDQYLKNIEDEQYSLNSNFTLKTTYRF